MERETIEVTDESSKAWPTYLDQVRDFAFAQADEFVLLGQDARSAGSIVANTLVIAAWEVASAGKIAHGGKPDPEKFRAAVNYVLEKFDFEGME